MAAVGKYVLDNPFRPASTLNGDASPGPCVVGDGCFGIPALSNSVGGEASRQQRAAAVQRGFKRPLPVWDFCCANCDQGFASQAELSVHCAEHVSCPREECDFAASPAVVALHEKLQHDSPFIRRSAASGNDEDLEEWRRQRRLRYPTLRNIEAKKAAEAERQARREVIREDARGRRRPRNNRRRQRARRRASPHRRTPQPSRRAPSPVKEESSPCEDLQDKPPPDHITDSDSDSEQRNVKAPDPPAPRPLVSGALASLMACYSSGSDDDEPASEEPQEQAMQREAAPPPPTELVSAKAAGSVMRGKATPPPRKTCWPPRRKLTLLERLLAPEVRHERNVILQCVHYVVDNDFFGETGPEAATRGKLGTTAVVLSHQVDCVQHSGFSKQGHTSGPPELHVQW